MLSAEELLAGSGLTYEIEVPSAVLHPGSGNGTGESGDMRVRLRPLTVRDLQLVTRAARENDSLLGALMVQRALLEPQMSVAQVAGMHVGLLQFLLDEVNRISGIAVSDEAMAGAMEAPLAKAAFVLAQEYGWTPQQVSELTLGQVLLHLQMLGRRSES
jgi:hypothetical protein